jgi:hypothetical protein
MDIAIQGLTGIDVIVPEHHLSLTDNGTKRIAYLIMRRHISFATITL